MKRIPTDLNIPKLPFLESYKLLCEELDIRKKYRNDGTLTLRSLDYSAERLNLWMVQLEDRMNGALEAYSSVINSCEGLKYETVYLDSIFSRTSSEGDRVVLSRTIDLGKHTGRGYRLDSEGNIFLYALIENPQQEERIWKERTPPFDYFEELQGIVLEFLKGKDMIIT